METPRILRAGSRLHLGVMATWLLIMCASPGIAVGLALQSSNDFAAWAREVRSDLVLGDAPGDTVGLYPFSVGERILSVGLFYGSTSSSDLRPAKPAVGTIEEALSQVGKSTFLVDLTAVPARSPAGDWLRRKQVSSVGFFFPPVPSFDALIFIPEVSEIKLISSAARKRDALE